MNLHFLAISLRKDWARVVRDPSQFAVALGIPLVLAVMFSLVFGRQPAVPHGLLLVADEDNTMASRRLLDGFHTGPLAAMVTVEKVSADAGRARLDRGDASAFLLIPKGLQMAFAFNQPIRLQLVTNPSQNILPRMIGESLSMTVEGAFYLRRVAGPQLQNLASGNLPPAVDQYFRPPLIRLESAAAPRSGPPRSFAATFLPSMLFMGLLFLASGTAADIWKERTAGTLRRIASSPVSMASYLCGRVVFVALLYLIVSVAGLLAAQWMAGMPVPDLPAAALWITFAGTIFYLIFLWITVQPATPRAAAVLVNLIIFPLAMLGGCFFPFEWMPAWMANLGRLTPNGWALTTFKTILDGTVDSARLLLSAALLAALGAVAFGFVLRRLRNSFAV